MMKIAYLDCFSGISGDMFMGALLDAGLSFKELDGALKTMPFEDYHIEVRREERNHIAGTRFMVKVDKDRHAHRRLEDIKNIIQTGDLSRAVKEKSIRIFESIAMVEGSIHNLPPGEVHFHEVGAVDSIIDIVGAVFGIESLNIQSIHASALPLGSGGFVETRHGRIPVPAPATLALLKDVPVYDSGVKNELVTPTGAALVKTLASSFGMMPDMVVEGIGYGVGTQNLADRPNLLRIVIGRDQASALVETVMLLEANLDDTNPEWLGYLMDRLFEAGALDVLFCPVQMKKNRPGTLLQVMGRAHQKDDLMGIIFRETTTLGIRFRHTQRRILERELVVLDSPWGKIQVKRVIRPDGSIFFLPEYEACRQIATKNGLPMKDIYEWVISANKK